MNYSISIKRHLKRWIIHKFLTFDAHKLNQTLTNLGIKSGDILMVHSSWLPDNGFSGKPAEMIAAIKGQLGPDGLLVMPSMPYHNESTAEYLSRQKPLKLQRTPSKMGLLTEVFRRGKNVLRSPNPAHPLLAYGEKAEWFIEGHDQVSESFGSDSPFSKLLKLNGKILCIDAPFSTITFTHFLEDRVKDQLGFDFYEPEAMAGVVIDANGDQLPVPTRVISRQANKLRREERLVQWLDDQKLIRRARVGNSRLLLVDCEKMTQAVDTMYAQGHSFFDKPDASIT